MSLGSPRDLPTRTIPEYEFLGAIVDRLDRTNELLAELRDRLPAPASGQPEPATEQPTPITIREPATVDPVPQEQAKRPARAGNRRAKGRA